MQQGVWAKLDDALRPVLLQLWEQGYTQGLTISGRKVAAYTVAATVGQLAAAWLGQIIRTTVKLIAGALIAGVALATALADKSRADVIATTEANRAIQQAIADSFSQEGATYVRWVTGGPNPCVHCLANEAQGPWPIGVPFVSGALIPPQHPNCRCSIEKA